MTRKVTGREKCLSSLWTASSLFFSSDLVSRVHARASIERRSRAPLLSQVFSHARGHLGVSGVLLDGPRKKRDGVVYLLSRATPFFCGWGFSRAVEYLARYAMSEKFPKHSCYIYPNIEYSNVNASKQN